MKTCNAMQTIITQIAQRHGCDLTFDGAYLHLDMVNFDRLVVERVGPNQLSVAHYFEQEGDLIADPEIVFFTGGEIWTPIAIKQVRDSQRRAVAWLTPDSSAIERVLEAEQADVAQFANVWARNIKEQCWLQDGVLIQMTTRPIEKPTE